MSLIHKLFGRVGIQYVSDGTHAELRMGTHGDLIVAAGKGKYAEAAQRGQIFVVSTAVAGIAPGTALGTTPPMAIHNPSGSNVLISILKVSLGYVSGTLGGGSIVYAEVTDAANPTGGTTLTADSTLLGNAAGKAYIGEGATVSATPTILRPSSIVLGGTEATTAVSYAPLVDDIDGEFLVPEGETFVIQGVAAAGTSPLVMIGVTYQEMPNS